jgi:hypothetical protein
MGLGKPLPALEDPTHHLGRTGAEPSYKETKEREAQQGGGWGRSTDEVLETEQREGPLLKDCF